MSYQGHATGDAPVGRARTLWAKSSKAGPGHSLMGHLLDVGIVARRLLQDTRLDPAIRSFAQDLRLELEAAKKLLIILAALHDIGKASPAFQSKWPEGAPPEALQRRVADIPHGTISAIVLKDWLREKGMHSKEAETLAHATGVHHGVTLPTGLSATFSIESAGIGGAPWVSWRNELIDAVMEAFGPLPEFSRHKGYRRSVSWAFLAGLTSVADWIGSGLPHAPVSAGLAAYISSRENDLAVRLVDIDWPLEGNWWVEPSSPDKFASWFQGTRAGENPRPLQLAVQDALGRANGEQFLLAIEAPMGEGKTEAAIFAAVRAAGQGLYIGLPTQATSDALHSRLTDFVERHANRRVHIALAHGAARVKAALGGSTASVVLAPMADLSLDPVEEEGAEAASDQALWLTMGRRELLAELGVGTVDQALLAVLPTKHHFVRAWALGGKVVVLDEVHAYDRYTFGLLEELVEWLASMGSTVIVMSATLPQGTRASLVEAFQRGRESELLPPESVPYPRLTMVTQSEVQSRAFEASRESRIGIAGAPYEIEALGRFLLDLQADGGAVGVIVNVVSRAQQLYEFCVAAGTKPLLLHSRMPLRQRQEREAELLERYGADSEGRRDGLVISTQVMEQSLDVDFDVLVSDMAPVDLLLQRAGRMHRHQREGYRGPHEEAMLYVAGFGDNESGPNQDAMELIYNEYIMWRSWAALTKISELRLPGDIDSLVQQVYNPNVSVSLPPTASVDLRSLANAYTTRTEVLGAEAADRGVGSPFEPASQAWLSVATDDECRARGMAIAPTRLSERRLQTLPVFVSGGRWRVPGDDKTVSSTAGRVSTEWLRMALMSQIGISNVALIAKLENRPRPEWWTKHKLLRFIYPLELGDDGTAIVDPNVRLDADLGLVIGRPPSEGRGR